MRKVYFVQPMKGMTDEEILKARKRAISAVETAIEEPIKDVPKLINDMEHGLAYNLGKSIQQMDGCYMVVFLPGWENASGCIVEKEVADAYGYEQHEVEDRGGYFEMQMGQMSMGDCRG